MAHMQTLDETSRRLALSRCGQWLLVVVIGCCCAVMSFAVNLGVAAMDKLRYTTTNRFIYQGGGFWLPWLVFNAISCAAAAVAGAGTSYIAPLAAGSGIQHIKAYCNGIDIPGLLTFKTLMVKMVGAMFSIGCGLVAGKEGPFIQCGACIAALALQASNQAGGWLNMRKRAAACSAAGADSGTALFEQPPADTPPAAAMASSKDVLQGGCEATEPAGADSTLYTQPTHERQQQQQQQAWNSPATVQLGHQLQDGSAAYLAWQQYEDAQQQQRQQHHQVAMGAGAGVAAAFIAPLSGAAYSVEEATTTYSGSLMTQTFLVGAVVVFFMWLFSGAAALGGRAIARLMFQSPLELAFRGHSGTDVRFWWFIWEVPVMLLLGTAAGAAMAAWTALNMRLQAGRKALLRGPGWRVADVVLCCLLTNSIRLAAGYMSPCVPLPAAAVLRALEAQAVTGQLMRGPIGMHPQLWCPEGQFSMYGQLFMQPLDVSVRSLFTYDAAFNQTNLLNQASAYNGSSGDRTAAALAPAVVDEQSAFSSGVLAAYFVFVWGMLLLSYGMSAPTGIFIPCLAAGAAGGRLMGHLLRAVLRARGILLPICMPAWSVMGAAAILTGCTRLGLSNALIVLESSGAVPLTIPLVLLMVPAKLVADAINEGVYDAQIDALGYLFLPPADTLHSSQRAALQYCKVLDLVQSDPTRAAAGLRCADQQLPAHLQQDGSQPWHKPAQTQEQQQQQKQQQQGLGLPQQRAAAGSSSSNSSSELQPCNQQESIRSAAETLASAAALCAGSGGAVPCSKASATGALQLPAPSAHQTPEPAEDWGASMQQLELPPNSSVPLPAAVAAGSTACFLQSAAQPPPPGHYVLHIGPQQQPAAAAAPAAAAVSGHVQCHQLLVAGCSSIHTAYVAMRELGLRELPVLLLAPQQGPDSSSNDSTVRRSDGGESNTSGSGRSTNQRGACSAANSAVVLQQSPQHHWQPGQQASEAEQVREGKNAVVLHSLPREAMLPAAILKACKQKRE